MKRLLIIMIGVMLFYIQCFCQSIPVGFSSETINVEVFFDWDNYVTDNIIEYDTTYVASYYKPLTYNPSTSPIIWYVHGMGGSGSEAYFLQSYADRRNALLIGLTMHNNWAYAYELFIYWTSQTTNIYDRFFLPEIFKQTYKHVLERENRDSIPVYLTGFSAGGQCVARYMLMRQGVPDSIPIINSASVSPWSYTFPTSFYNGTDMFFPCGFGNSEEYGITFSCNDHVKQYYNENFSLFIGTADTVNSTSVGTCVDIQGIDRLERAQTFYAFCDSNAINIGTTLSWQYNEIPNIGHDGVAMYNYILSGDSIPQIERILFESPYSQAPSLAPIASFVADTTTVTLPNSTIQFTNNSINAVSYEWSFGDGFTSSDINPIHTYLFSDTFHVSLTAYNIGGCINKCTKNKYIIVLDTNMSCQPIPLGFSYDTIPVNVEIGYLNMLYDTNYFVRFYKPQNYSNLTSPILWYIHDIGESSASAYNLMSYADRRNAMIVSVKMHGKWDHGYDSFYYDPHYYPEIFKQIYQYILVREDRDSIPVYLTGFSAGGQCVSRYMLKKQVIIDSIPIIHATSVSPSSYWFPIWQYNGTTLYYPCGGGFDNCIDYKIQYYNENYSNVIGADDTTDFWGGFECMEANQGIDRLDRARNFYAFCDSDAVSIGTTLNWQYAELPGIAYDNNAMYNYIPIGDSIPYIERLLFETPYYQVPYTAPIASFDADTTIVFLPNATVNFINNSINATSYYWEFGDGNYSYASNPSYTYQNTDSFQVSLSAFSSTCAVLLIKDKYIIVKNGISVNEINRYSGNLQIFPNPSNGQITIKTDNESIESIEIYNCMGSKTDEIITDGNHSSYMYNLKNLKGLYVFKVKTKYNVYTLKVLFI